MIKIRTIGEAQLAAVRQLLASCQLPFEDLSFTSGEFVGVFNDHQLVGCGRVEQYGRWGLLRSVALIESFRGRQLGKGIIQHLEQWATEKGLTAMYLLTETARDFFSRLDYQWVIRDRVPDVLKTSSGFAQVCPSSAVAMVKFLKPKS